MKKSVDINFNTKNLTKPRLLGCEDSLIPNVQNKPHTIVAGKTQGLFDIHNYKYLIFNIFNRSTQEITYRYSKHLYTKKLGLFNNQ